ncbi:hypothetical protein AB0M05_37575 [Streptomyces violaceusniger]|uniref:hypothetical protein n=1 Tax=Streptomyces violaceusniger TaxID=68280 RepID=UPI003432971D
MVSALEDLDEARSGGVRALPEVFGEVPEGFGAVDFQSVAACDVEHADVGDVEVAAFGNVQDVSEFLQRPDFG